MGERVKACRLANKICARERSGKCKVKIVEDCKHTPEDMIDALGEKPAKLAKATDDNITPIQVHRAPAVLYQVTTDSGSLQVNKVSTAPFSQDSLNTGDCFLVDAAAANKIFVWKGKEANGDERKAAIDSAEKFIDSNNYPKETNIEVLPESGESTYFKEFFDDWKHVEESAGLKYFNLRPPKLFAVSDADGSIGCEEILGSLEQTDLLPQEVMILDCFDKIFVWIGEKSSDVEKEAAPGYAKDFLASDPRGRSADTPIEVFVQGSESGEFKSYFEREGWDENCFVDPHEALLKMAENMKILEPRFN